MELKEKLKRNIVFLLLLTVGVVTLFLLFNKLLVFTYVGMFSYFIWVWLILFLVLFLYMISLLFSGQFFTLFTVKLVFVRSIIFLFIFFILTVFIIVNVFVSFLPYNSQKNDDNTSASNQPVGGLTVTPSAEGVLLPKENFRNGLGAWYEEVWYKKADSLGEVTTGSSGVTFTSIESNSRSGIMYDLNTDITKYKKVLISATVTAKIQTLPGTGMQGREAPVAIAVSYTDTNSVKHTSMAENPNTLTNMFWRGFYYIDPSTGYDDVNGIKVTQNSPYQFTFDLMTLDPRPKIIHSIYVEGAGWKERQGSVTAIDLVGEK